MKQRKTNKRGAGKGKTLAIIFVYVLALLLLVGTVLLCIYLPTDKASKPDVPDTPDTPDIPDTPDDPPAEYGVSWVIVGDASNLISYYVQCPKKAYEGETVSFSVSLRGIYKNEVTGITVCSDNQIWTNIDVGENEGAAIYEKDFSFTMPDGDAQIFVYIKSVVELPDKPDPPDIPDEPDTPTEHHLSWQILGNEDNLVKVSVQCPESAKGGETVSCSILCEGEYKSSVMSVFIYENGKYFQDFLGSPGIAYEHSTDFQFTMPDGDVEIVIRIACDPSEEHNLSWSVVGNDYGLITCNVECPKKEYNGQTVSFSALFSGESKSKVTSVVIYENGEEYRIIEVLNDTSAYEYLTSFEFMMPNGDVEIVITVEIELHEYGLSWSFVGNEEGLIDASVRCNTKQYADRTVRVWVYLTGSRRSKVSNIVIKSGGAVLREIKPNHDVAYDYNKAFDFKMPNGDVEIVITVEIEEAEPTEHHLSWSIVGNEDNLINPLVNCPETAYAGNEVRLIVMLSGSFKSGVTNVAMYADGEFLRRIEVPYVENLYEYSNVFDFTMPDSDIELVIRIEIESSEGPLRNLSSVVVGNEKNLIDAIVHRSQTAVAEEKVQFLVTLSGAYKSKVTRIFIRKDGKYLKDLEVEETDTAYEYSKFFTFIMPDGDVEIVVTVDVEIPATLHNVKLTWDGYSPDLALLGLSASCKETAYADEKVKVSVKVTGAMTSKITGIVIKSGGKILQSIDAGENDYAGNYSKDFTFVMPDSDVEIIVTVELKHSIPPDPVPASTAQTIKNPSDQSEQTEEDKQ